MKSISLVFCFAFTILRSAATDQFSSDSQIRVDTTKSSAQLSTELYDAIANNNVTATKILLENGANPNTYNDDHTSTMLQQALGNSVDVGEEIIDLLIEHGANVNETELADGHTPLHDAIILGHKKTIEMLIERGADVNAMENERKMTPLHYIIIMDGVNKFTEDDRLKIVELLINHGADVNKTDSYGQTPLFQAIFMGHKKSIELLIERGSNVNAVENRWKYTPLHLIASVGDDDDFTEDECLEIAELLINHGADLYAKRLCFDGYKTPLGMAKLPKMKEYLRSKMT